MPISDQQARDNALDPTRSFIVQAPAGSGKTELLTQRFLCLLSCVKAPEEILAITFTRKAAFEMRARIIQALQKAAEMIDPPSESHAQKTWMLAKNALKNDARYHWHLINNPNRLQIQTIDAFCAGLIQQTPLLSHFGSQLNLTENATVLYQKAVRNLLSTIIDESSPWKNAFHQLLLHLDNKLEKTEALFIDMLSKRDQWLPHIVYKKHQTQLDPQKSRQKLENSLYTINQDCLNNLHDYVCHHLPITWPDELLPLLQFAGQHIEKDSPIQALASCENFPDSSLANKEIWRGIAQILLTDNNTWRKKPDKRVGFPTSNLQIEKTFFEQQKTNLITLIETLQEHEAFRVLLTELKTLPPLHYTEAEWGVLLALFELLPLATAQLMLVFQENHETDFIELSQTILKTLDTAEAPSDLLLMLDNKIQHILVDEFQDTSITHFRLIEQLTTGWTGQDGRTLFIVGDPMQSIYRFRNAEVGLFLRTQHESIGAIHLTSLVLSANFRSQKNLIDWFNATFAAIFPSIENISEGAMKYAAAESVHPALSETVRIHPLFEDQQEAEGHYIAALIQSIQRKNPMETIAILVRARSQLTNILASLRQHHIAYQAVDIDSLKESPVVRDLLALTKVLLRPIDTIAWLSILRAPWCGLTLHDLHRIAQFNHKIPFFEKIHTPAIQTSLSESGQKRLKTLSDILSTHLATRGTRSLRDWIYDVWIDLNAPAYLTHPADLNHAEQYFTLLEQLDEGGDIPDFDQLEEKLETLYAAPDTASDHPVQVMTIHKAKGLEFDTVILPQLNTSTKPNSNPLLLWMEMPRTHAGDDLILAPIESFREKQSSIYSFLTKKNKQKNDYELCRLFYVAATRAKKQLHLIGTVKSAQETACPPHKKFLAYIWDEFSQAMMNRPKKIVANAFPDTSMTSVPFIRFSDDYFKSRPVSKLAPPISKTLTQNKISPLDIERINAQRIGDLIHNILKQISLEGLDQWPLEKISPLQDHWKNWLLQHDILPAFVEAACEKTEQAINNSLIDPKGRWILSAHREAHSEYALSYVEKHRLRHVIIDRTFIDEKGNRWVIDYKTSSPQHESLENFLPKEKTLYQQQLETYADALYALDTQRDIPAYSIRFALYFPMIPAWIEW